MRSRSRTPCYLLLAAEITVERPNHRQIDTRAPADPAGAPAPHGQVPAAGGDHIGVKIAYERRAAEPAGQPIAGARKIGPYWRRVLTLAARRRSARLPEQVAHF